MVVSPKITELRGPFRMQTLYEYTIPNEMFLNHMEMIKISADYCGIPVLEFCQNLLVRSYND